MTQPVPFGKTRSSLTTCPCPATIAFTQSVPEYALWTRMISATMALSFLIQPDALDVVIVPGRAPMGRLNTTPRPAT